MLIAIICWTAAAICCAFQEKIITHHSRSIWKNSPRTGFFGLDSWWRKYAKSYWPSLEFQRNDLTAADLDRIVNLAKGTNTANKQWWPSGWFWKWYYKKFNLPYRERFPFSATVLVFTTDGYHFFQWMMYNLFALGMGAVYGHGATFHMEHWLITSLIFRMLFATIYGLFFELILSAQRDYDSTDIPDHLKHLYGK